MNKTIGLILVTVGLGLTAGFGAFLSPDYRSALLTEGEATLSGAAVDAAFEEYCASREKNNSGARDGCAGSPPLVDSAQAETLSKVGLIEAQLAALASKEKDEVLLIDTAMARVGYRLALKKSLKLWQKVEAAETQGPGARLSGWLGSGGVGFGFGLLFLVVGSWICRKAASSEAESETPSDDGPVDFGVLLTSVREAIAGLVADMDAETAPTVDALEAYKDRLEEVQKDEMARLCASGPLVQRRYGLQGMASLFSPLSSAERKMNRTWAALVDRHWPESMASISGALHDLEAAQTELVELQSSSD